MKSRKFIVSTLLFVIALSSCSSVSGSDIEKERPVNSAQLKLADGSSITLTSDMTVSQIKEIVHDKFHEPEYFNGKIKYSFAFDSTQYPEVEGQYYTYTPTAYYYESRPVYFEVKNSHSVYKNASIQKFSTANDRYEQNFMFSGSSITYDNKIEMGYGSEMSKEGENYSSYIYGNDNLPTLFNEGDSLKTDYSWYFAALRFNAFMGTRMFSINDSDETRFIYTADDGTNYQYQYSPTITYKLTQKHLIYKVVRPEASFSIVTGNADTQWQYFKSLDASLGQNSFSQSLYYNLETGDLEKAEISFDTLNPAKSYFTAERISGNFSFDYDFSEETYNQTKKYVEEYRDYLAENIGKTAQ